MSQRKYKCKLIDLLTAGDTITGAALDPLYATSLNLRLAPPYISDSVALIADIRSKHTARAGKQGDIGTLTLAEQKLLKALLDLMSKARETAKRAFKGDKVKLHDQFCMGKGKTDKSAAGILSNGRIISGAIKSTDNAAAMLAKGWLPADTQKLDAAIAAAAAGLLPQQPGKSEEKEQTAFLVSEGNDLYDRLLDIQNAADIEWPASDPANVAVRAKFLLGVFPYYYDSGGDEPTPPTPPAPNP
jgi:hypothetical protein